LRVSDALSAARELLQVRAPLYAEAHHEVDTEGFSVEDVSTRVLELLGLYESTTGTE
jgi:hypothetical protein